MRTLARTLALVSVLVGVAAQLPRAASGFTYSTLAGTAGTVVNLADGVGSDAQFDAPRGLAVDRAGNVYIADTSNNAIRKMTPDGAVTTFAGVPGTGGYADGPGATAKFNEPFDVAVDDAGNVYVADASNNAIRQITAAGVVSTLAGGGGSGTTDGTGTAAKLDEPRALAIDRTGTIYVADYDNQLVRRITSGGVVTTVAGTADVPGNADGRGTSASFRAPMGIAVDEAGIVYVGDSGNRAIRRIAADGTVTTMTLSGTRFTEPHRLVVAPSGTIYVADYGSHSIRAVSASGVVTTVAGAVSSPGTADGQGTSAGFQYPEGLALTASGSLLVADAENDTIRAIDANGVVTTLAGRAGRVSTTDGVGADARFEDPFSIAADAGGVVYVTDAAAHVIRRITPDGAVQTYAGTPGQFGIDDGTAFNARFYSPFGIAVDAAGTLYVADTYNSTIRKVTAGGVVTTFAGLARQRGHTDGTGAAARFDQPFGIATDGAGNVYVSDSIGNTIRKITPAGVVTTLAGGSAGSADGVGTAASFQVPFGIAADTAGTVYVVDHGNHAIRKVTPQGVVTTLAGRAGAAGYVDGQGADARFRFPSGIAVDRAGIVYVADTDNHVIRQITPDGQVTTVGGLAAHPGSTDGDGSTSRFFNPKDIAVDQAGQLYVADRGNRVVRKGTP